MERVKRGGERVETAWERRNKSLGERSGKVEQASDV